MSIPTSTYRLQFRCGMTFGRAAGLAPYLARLGVSHLYASPIFLAAPGSTHGYDVLDYGAIDPDLGGEEEFRHLSEALAREGLKLLLDFVPNHMSASPLNPWWRDVLEWGARSSYASTFDIDWSAPRLIVPALAKSYGQALSDGDFRIDFDPCSGTLSFSAGGVGLPLHPPSYAGVLDRMNLSELARRFAASPAEDVPALKQELAAALRNADPSTALRSLGKDRAFMHELHEAQNWRFAHWRAARETLTYRRFFEISELVGVRVEVPSVFEAVHRKLFELVREGLVHAVRIDHVDGLADPRRYLERLRDELGEGVPIYVEKILAREEELRRTWPVAGTTGYEFIADLADVYVDPEGDEPLTEAYHALLGGPVDYRAEVRGAKRRILTRNLAGELDFLTGLIADLAARDLATRDFGRDTLRRAIIEAIAVLPVYRSYVGIDGADEQDVRLIDEAVASAKVKREVEDEGALDFLARVLKLDLVSSADQAAAVEFAARFQQTTSAVAAKAVEDTVFYTYTRLLGLNEVGGEPARFGGDVAGFHRAMATRAVHHPATLNATATHDTKRGEDARARLYALSEAPEEWVVIVELWRSRLADHYRDIAGMPAPEPHVEWMIFQSLAGHWPRGLGPGDAAGLSEFRDRLVQFVRKALREGKQRTSWVAPDSDYEAAVEKFAALCVDPAVSPLAEVLKRLAPLFAAGEMTSYSQTLLKLMAPGVPDIYQGTEDFDFSFVDPDNRRSLDEAGLSDHLSILQKRGEASGDLKHLLLAKGLGLRRRLPRLFAEGRYEPLAVEGEKARHVVAFVRVHAEGVAIAIAPRLCLELLDGASAPMFEPAKWGDTHVLLPPSLRGRMLQEEFSGEQFETEGRLRLSPLLSRYPVAMLTSAGNATGQ